MITALTTCTRGAVLGAGRALLAVARILSTVAYAFCGGRRVEAAIIGVIVVPVIVAMTAKVARGEDPRRWRSTLWALGVWGGITALSFLLAAFSAP